MWESQKRDGEKLSQCYRTKKKTGIWLCVYLASYHIILFTWKYMCMLINMLLNGDSTYIHISPAQISHSKKNQHTYSFSLSFNLSFCGLDKLDYFEIRNFHSAKDNAKSIEDNSHTGRKYLQKVYMINVCCPKYMKNS